MTSSRPTWGRAAARAKRLLTRFNWVKATPLGWPVLPEVNITVATSRIRGGGRGGGGGGGGRGGGGGGRAGGGPPPRAPPPPLPPLLPPPPPSPLSPAPR